MAVAVKRAMLFLAGGVAAAAVTAYFAGALDPYLGRGPEVAAVEPPAPQTQADTKEGRLPTQGQAAQPDAVAPAASSEQASQPAAAEAPAEQAAAEVPATGEDAQSKTPDVAAAVQAPSFDIVRAEADGSLVIAGKAAARAQVEIVLGAKVIGKTMAGPEGDFAVAIDEPLKPGDHQIVLRSTNPDNVVSTSPETAVVSIPEAKSGQVLALVEQPGAPSKLISVPEPEPAAKLAQTPAATQPAPSGDTAAEDSGGKEPEQQAALSAKAASGDSAGTPAVAAGPTVKVEAVEIEGRKVFIAGIADPGRKVRGYANDILLGEVVTSPGGRFLIEAERDLPAGDYIIRADALGPDGVKVVARAAVPFEREAAEAQAAVAPSPVDAAKEGQAVGAEGAVSEAPSAQPETVKPVAGAGEVAAAAPEELAPKLQNVDGAVIIRRGDSLWRISRRVYGLGVRYSTIYLANQDQIRDPDRIWPGQVFKVPEKTAHGEAADMKAVGEQATTLPQ